MADGQNGTRRPRVTRGPARPSDPDVTGPPSVNRLPVVLERLAGGRLRMTSPDLPGWSAVASGVHELGRNVDQAWVELQIAAYARTRDTTYDAERHDARDPTPPRVRPLTASGGERIWRYSHDPADWRPLPGGDWESPSGRRYRGDSAAVAKVVARRGQLGLPCQATEEETP